MKKLFGLAMVFAAVVSTQARAEAKVGEAAPAFELKDVDGKAHSLASFKGKTVVLEWLNHECPFVKKHYDSGNMQKLQESATKDGVIWLSIASSAPGKEGYMDAVTTKKVSAEKKSKATAVLLDASGAVGKVYGAKVTPHMYVIDGTGKLVYNGAIDDKASTKVEDVKGAKSYVSEALASVKKGEAVKVSATKPYGCGVKYKD
ncbi:MAG TPA: thioredoxin family protein [Bdellovibrionota bacterium]|jgi:peroxiredoxin|nr:thioredoxin family protein [Bdellovibrionota bacterium]